MDCLEAVQRRRSIRKFKRVAMPEDDVKRIMEAGRLAPTDATLHLWTAVRVADSAVRSEVAKLIGQSHVEEASEFFVFLADLYRLRELLRYRDVQMAERKLALFIFAAVDAAIAAENMALAATALGYGTCFIGAVQNAPREIARMLELPDLTYPLFGLAIGVPDEDPEPRPRLPLELLFHRDRYRRYGEADLEDAYKAMARVTRSGDWLKVLSKYGGVGGYFDLRSAELERLLREFGIL
ncbi:nitroreductase family protein [Pyrobaculum neutrophilum]|uniref:Nitroreductase n=1 Tax=Pyrobaculum neutrophilum (strain DSM 2338 / JCM 9278 / NBRC 100436 / V24Sta) TaxID=444157 RepID=B1Y9D5_PYRNV|nr:nitroreductase family protein [Pyrobaculum neutrophilum]ACB40364.1 nitroreductase [Pyrobaculum neutrophilum V24Sta]